MAQAGRHFLQKRETEDKMLSKENKPSEKPPFTSASLAYFMWFGGAGTSAHSGFKKK